MEFTTSAFEEFRKDLSTALAPLEEKHGIKIEQGNISYQKYDFSLKLTATKTTGDNGINVEEEKFKQYCQSYGFKPEDYRREFTNGNTRYCLVGFNPRSPKNCCSIENVKTGKIFGCTKSTVTIGFEIEEKKNS